MPIKFANNASATLASAITNSATTITLTAGMGARFPSLSAGEFFYGTLVDINQNLEIVKVTARSTDTLTVVRAQDGTTARAYAGGSLLQLRLERAVFDQFPQIDVAYSDPSWIALLSETKVLPSQTNNAGKVLTTNGTNTSWVDFPGRNRLINGDMRIVQRGTSFTGIGFNNGSAYGVDRFRVVNSNATGYISATQVTDAPPGFSHSLLVQTTTATSTHDNEVYIEQQIEGLNCTGFAFGTASASPLTISFWAKCSLAGTYNTWLYNTLASKNRGQSFTISSANTWEYKTILVPADTAAALAADNSSGLILRFYLDSTAADIGILSSTWTAGGGKRLASGSVRFLETLNNTFQITGVQLEKGSQATEFERRFYGLEDLLCKRYYCTGGNGSPGIFNGSTTARYSVILPVPMRTTPTTTAIAAPIIINPQVAEQQTGSQTTSFSVTGYGASVNYSVAQIQFGGFSGGADGRPTTLLNTALAFSAEL